MQDVRGLASAHRRPWSEVQTAEPSTRRSEVVELLVIGVLAFTAMLVLSVLIGVLGLVTGIVLLPFRIIGWAFKLFGFLLALPLLVIPTIVVGTVLLVVLGVALLPILPVVVLGYVIYRLARGRAHSPRSQASVVS